jgi:hypothetical protein
MKHWDLPKKPNVIKCDAVPQSSQQLNKARNKLKDEIE